MRYSVLVPLEFHRGLALRCIRRWIEEQAFAREEYEVLVAAAESHPVDLDATVGRRTAV